MTETSSAFAPEQFRGYLLLLARSQWNEVLQSWGDPSDLVQETLIEACRNLAAFRGETVASFVAWLRTILSRNLLDKSRALHRDKRDCQRKKSLDAALEESSARLGVCLAEDGPSPFELAVKAEQLNLLANALARLPADQLMAVTLHHLRGLTLEATATEMGRTHSSVAGLLRRGLDALGTLMFPKEVSDGTRGKHTR